MTVRATSVSAAAMLICPGLLPCFAAPEHAECPPSYVGARIKPRLASDVIPMLAAEAGPKGESESAAGYKKRMTAATAKFGKELVLRLDNGVYPGADPYDGKVSYDADRKVLKIARAARRDQDSYYPEEIEGFPTFTRDDVRLTVQTHKVITGSYSAHNALGVAATIKTERWDFYFVASKGAALSDVLEVPSTEEQANALKTKLGFALVVRPNAPFYGMGADHTLDASPDNPDIHMFMHVLVADVACALVTDEANKVVAIWPTD